MNGVSKNMFNFTITGISIVPQRVPVEYEKTLLSPQREVIEAAHGKALI